MGFDQFVRDSIDLVDSLQADLQKGRTDLINYFQEKLLSKISNGSSGTVSLQDRIKTSHSLKEKIIRKNYYEKHNGNAEEFIKNLPDMIGVRCVCLLQKDEEIINKNLDVIFSFKDAEYNNYMCLEENANSRFIIKLNGKVDIQKNGHKIYKYEAKWIDIDGKVFNVELQIKSLVHMFWGEMEHMLIYKNYRYVIDKQFYQNIMSSCYSLLLNIDTQLLAISNHLKEDNAHNEEELKEVVANILYKNYQRIIEAGIDSKIDLRDIYDTIVKMLYHSKNNTNSILNLAQQHISRGETYSLNFESLESIKKEQLQLTPMMITSSESGMYRTLDELIKNGDIRWGILYTISCNLDGEDSYTDNIAKIVDNLTKRLRLRYQENITVDDEKAITLLLKTISISINRSLYEYKKVDYFMKEELILEIIDNFIFDAQEDIESLVDNGVETHQLSLFLEEYLTTKILIGLDIIPTTAKLKEQLELLNSLEWSPKQLKLDDMAKLVDNDDYINDDLIDFLKYKY